MKKPILTIVFGRAQVVNALDIHTNFDVPQNGSDADFADAAKSVIEYLKTEKQNLKIISNSTTFWGYMYYCSGTDFLVKFRYYGENGNQDYKSFEDAFAWVNKEIDNFREYIKNIKYDDDRKNSGL